MWWHRPIIPALRRLQPRAHSDYSEFKATEQDLIYKKKEEEENEEEEEEEKEE